MFYYQALYWRSLDEPPSGLIVVEGSPGPLRAVIWNHRVKAWTCDPDSAAWILYDDRNSDRWSEVDRARAEEIARSLGTELPSEPELHRICGEPAPA